jgi:hypothetical protein
MQACTAGSHPHPPPPPPPPPWCYSPGWALAFFKRVFHSSRLAAVTFHPLHPILAVSSSICSSHLNLGLPLGRLPLVSQSALSLQGHFHSYASHGQPIAAWITTSSS